MIQYCEAAAARKDGAHTSESDALCANLFFFVQGFWNSIVSPSSFNLLLAAGIRSI